MITSILMPIREQNIRQVIEGIRAQSVHSNIWIWDDTGKYKGVGEDVYFYCNKNFSHRPRFLIAGMAKTEYIYIQDDDFKIADKDLFKKLIEACKNKPEYIFGVSGRNFNSENDKEKPYQDSKGWINEGECQFINTGLSFFRTELLNKLEILPNVSEIEYQYGDDMYISSRNKCYTTEIFKLGVDRLDEQGKGLSKQSMHMDIRNRLVKRYWL